MHALACEWLGVRLCTSAHVWDVICELLGISVRLSYLSQWVFHVFDTSFLSQFEPAYHPSVFAIGSSYLWGDVVTSVDLSGILEVLREMSHVLNEAVSGGARHAHEVPYLKVLNHLAQTHPASVRTHRNCSKDDI